MIKKSLITELPGPSSQAFVLVRVNEGDRLISVGLTDNKNKEILLVTALGMAIRFKEDDVRPMGLVAAGVNGIKLDDDEVVGAEILPGEGEVFLLTNDGKAKRVDEKDFPAQGRYGKGVIAWDLPGKEKLVGAVTGKPNHMATIHLSKGAPKSTRLDAVALRKRAATKGDHVVEVKPGEEVVSVNVGWTVEKFVEEESGKKNGSVKKSAGKKKVESGKKKAAPKKSAPAKKAKASVKKAKPTAKKPAPKAKPAKKTVAKTTSKARKKK